MPEKITDRKKEKKYRLILVFLTFFWFAAMVMIFIFSSKPADLSTLQSHAVDEIICKVVIRNFSDLAEYVRYHYIELIDKFVRKSAHFCEYMLLGLLTFSEVKMISSVFPIPVLRKFSKKSFIFFIYILSSCVFCFLYACTDEIHQYFVPGRYSSFTDVLIDFSGAFVGIMIAFLLIHAVCGKKSCNIW